MTPEELSEELGRGEIRPIYLLAGPEPLLREDALGEIRKAVLGEAPADFNLDRLDGASVRPAELLDSVGMLPVMAERRLVVLREPEGRRGDAKALTDALTEAVPSLSPEGTTVLVVTALKADKRARWVKAFGKARVECEAPTRARELAGFVRAESKRQGVTLERDAVELLIERVGPQLLLLRREIEKAALLAGSGEKILRQHVADGASDLAEEPVWDLTDAIGEGRAADALGVLGKLLGSGAAPPMVLGALVNHFRRLLRVKTGGDVAGPPFVRRKLETQARRLTERRLLASLRAIHQTDLAIKGEGGLKPDLALERLVISLV